MAIVTMKELFDRAADFEERLERCYADIRDNTTDNGVRLLTYYLARHRRHLDQALSELQADAILHVKKVQVKYDIDFHPDHDFHVIETPATEITAKELLDSAVGYDEQLIRLYTSMLDQPIGEEATVLVEALIRLEEKDIVMLKKMLAMNYF
jgi:rubrerythrin